MKKTDKMIAHIPAVLYGASAGRVFLFVHGKQGCKEESETLAQIACPMGYQVLGIDLPGHGARTGESDSFVPWKVVPELQTVMRYAKAHWQHVSLRANSIGAWFSMLALQEEPPEQSLFVSPVVDMQQLIENMMGWAGVSEEKLAEQKRIPTDFGETLDWTYHQYVKAHPIRRWNVPTAILYGSEDNLTSRATMTAFAQRFHCDLTVMEGGEHWFHTPEQLRVLEQWTREAVRQWEPCERA